MTRTALLALLALSACSVPFDPEDGGMGIEITGAEEITGAAWLAEEYASVAECLGEPVELARHKLARYYTAERIVEDGQSRGGLTVGEYLYATEWPGSESTTRGIMRHEMVHYITGLSHGEGFKAVEDCGHS